MRIWVIGASDTLASRIRAECPGFTVTAVAREKIAIIAGPPALVVVDVNEMASGSSAIRQMRERWPAAPLLAVSAGIGEDTLPADVDDFVLMPFQPGELRLRILRLASEAGERSQLVPLRESISEIRTKYRLDAVIGESSAIEEAIRRVPPLGASEANVLITGATGTGKELFARAIHYASPRRARAFIPVNCGALPDTLFENELFGHEKGAYTDASAAGVGLLSIAEGGSLFLDEVDSLTPAGQAKLLRVLQDREYRPLGSQRLVKANVRIIAAANTPLPERMAAREFRPDLYYRLHVLSLQLPPLSERRNDIPILVRHFLARFAREYRRPVPKLAHDAIRRLTQYAWPGNVRELESVIQQAVVLSNSAVLGASALDLPDAWRPSPIPAAIERRTGMSAALGQFERQYLTSLLSEADGNVTRAAQAAGKDRRTFQRLLRRHGIRTQSAGAAG
ncbi:MAG: sigma-54 dependent transcriptional regulator [Bryobacteraceae bacterium]